MKQGNYLQVLNCTLKIKDHGRTEQGGDKKKPSGSKRCIVTSIKQTEHFMQRRWAPLGLLSQRVGGG